MNYRRREALLSDLEVVVINVAFIWRVHSSIVGACLAIFLGFVHVAASAQSNTFGPITVPGTAVIFDPDSVLMPTQLASLSANLSNGHLSATPAVEAMIFKAAVGRVLTISASGAIDCCNGTPRMGPDGYSPFLNIVPLGSISGYGGPASALVGVFTDGKPTGSAPANASYPGGTGQSSFAPLLNQVFFIGDGLTGTGSGSSQSFLVPSDATQLWLGVADAYVNGSGPPSGYGDNTGSFVVSGAVSTQNRRTITKGAPAASPDGENQSPANYQSSAPAQESYPPPPAGIPNRISGRPIKYDFNGAWEGYYASPAFPTVIQIHQEGLDITAESLRDDLTSTGRAFFRGSFAQNSSDATIEVASYSVLVVMAGLPLASWNDDTLRIVDPDHLQIGNKPAFQRITLPQPNDVPCSIANETKIGAQWAYMRAKVAQNVKDDASALCWLYVASVQGDARAQFYLAYFLHDGLGTKRDPLAAFHWTLQSAEHGSDYGAYALAFMYRRGDGTGADPEKAQYWDNRGRELKIQREKSAEAEEAQAEQQRYGLLELGTMGVLGAAILAEGVKQSPDCDQNPARNNAAELAAKQKRVAESGGHCENGEIVPNE